MATEKQDKGLVFKVDQFNRAMDQMAARIGKSSTKEKIIDNEVRKIVEVTIKKTTTATRKTVELSTISRGHWRTYDGKKYDITNRFPDSVWAKINARLKASLKRKMQAISLARRVWYDIGLRLGPVNAPAQTRKAKREGVPPGANGAVFRRKWFGEYGLTIANSSPLIRWSDSRQALFKAIAGRLSFFKKNLKHGVFNDLKEVAKKYPGLDVRIN